MDVAGDHATAGQRPSSGLPAARAVVLDALRAADGPMTVQQLAAGLALHTNTVRFHLSRLVQDGLAQEDQGQPDGPGRPRMSYRALQPAPGGDGGNQEYRLLAQILAGHLAASSADPGAAARTAGREWGRHLVDRRMPFDRPAAHEVVARVVRMLTELGFAPEPAVDGEIRLHHCPFLDVAQRHPGVVCQVHLGLIQGALDEMGARGDDATIEPLVTPRLCVTHVPVDG